MTVKSIIVPHEIQYFLMYQKRLNDFEDVKLNVEHFLKGSTYIVCTTLPAERLSLLPSFQKRRPDRISISRGRLLEKRGLIFSAGEGRGVTVFI